MKINPIDPFQRQTISINLATSNVNDPAGVLSAARRLSASDYHRYGSTVEFYIPNMYNEKFVNNAKGNGLDVII
ncbi:MAG: hypothetical protein R3Y28_04350 [Candidatus Gastranaerophilales bacterium]